jgi:hypothetical protein
VLHVASAWIDIQSIKATVVKAGATQLEVQIDQWPGRSIPVAILPTSEIDAPPQGPFVTGQASAVGVGDIVQLIGFGDLTAGTFAATRLFVLSSATYPAISGGPDDQVVTGALQPGSPSNYCPVTYYGIASYFDCSDNGACVGCNPCYSSYDQMAWPEMIFVAARGSAPPTATATSMAARRPAARGFRRWSAARASTSTEDARARA